MGILGWCPSEFWAATIWDLLAALDGYAIRIGARRDTGLDENAVHRLRALLDGEGA